MNNFIKELKNKIEKSIYNNFGRENYDFYRFGKYPETEDYSITRKIKVSVKRLIGYKKSIIADNYINNLYFPNELNWLWNILDKEGKQLLVELVAYRLLGHEKVKLSINNPYYNKAIEKSKTLVEGTDILDPNFLNLRLQKMNLNPIGLNIKLYFVPIGVAIDFIIEQYAYKKNKQILIGVEPGDTVLDIGGCWGDTALYFADKVGINGKVYTFEFIPVNIDLFNKNIDLNPHLKPIINLIPNPVSDKTGDIIYFEDFGPSSQIKMEPFPGQTGSAKTISIDDFVDYHSIQKIDFIKMDIEGAEPIALKGAINTIKKHRPKLAIAIYHSMDDFVNIPKWINDLGLGYELFLGHYTIHMEETIIFAKPKM